MIDPHQVKTHVIQPALEQIGMFSPAAAELVFFTGLVESRYQYIVQIGGPARSFWQIEPVTLFDHYENYLNYRPELKTCVDSLINGESVGVNLEFMLTVNMAYAAAMCRIKYRRSPMALPAVGDVEGQAHIWKQVYNTPQGAGSEEHFIQIVNSYKPIA
jgi:hypothetical protein